MVSRVGDRVSAARASDGPAPVPTGGFQPAAALVGQDRQRRVEVEVVLRSTICCLVHQHISGLRYKSPSPSRQVTSSTGAMCSGSRLLLHLGRHRVSADDDPRRVRICPQPGRRVAPPCTHRIISGIGCMLGGRRPGRNGRCQSSRLAGWCPRPVRPWKARGRRDRDGGVSLRSRIRRLASTLGWFGKRAADQASYKAGVVEVVRRSKRPRCSGE